MNKKELKQHLICDYCQGPTFGGFRTVVTTAYDLVGGIALKGERDIGTICNNCWAETPDTRVVTEDDPEVPHYLQAALFTRIVVVGEINPTGEVDYEGYNRVQFESSDRTNTEEIVFPEALADYVDAQDNPIRAMCLAALDAHEMVVGVKRL